MQLISARISDAERLERIKKLFPNEDEARDILAYDKAVDATKDENLQYDLTPAQREVARKFAHTGTRKAPTVYKFDKRTRKPNATKGGIIAELAEFLEQHSNFAVSDLAIPKPEGQITFKIGEQPFTINLIQNRKAK